MFLKVSEAFVANFLGHVSDDLFVVAFTCGDEGVDDSSEFVRSSGNPFGFAKLCLHSPTVIANGTFVSPQRHGAHAQLISEATLDRTSLAAEELVSGDTVVGTEAEP